MGTLGIPISRNFSNRNRQYSESLLEGTEEEPFKIYKDCIFEERKVEFP